MKYHNLNRANTIILKSLIREPYAWPGGYERFAITTDGAILCPYCLKKEFHTVMHSTKYQYRDGWEVAGCGYIGDYDDEMITCDHCNRNLATTCYQDYIISGGINR